MSQRDFAEYLADTAAETDPEKQLQRYKRLGSSTHPVWDVTGHEAAFLTLLINVSAGDTRRITHKGQAKKHLMDCGFIDKSLKCFEGCLTHNAKLFDSTQRGAYLKWPVEQDPKAHYVYSGSILGGRTLGYAQNGALVRHQKWLFTEFNVNKKTTCLALELASQRERFKQLLVQLGLSKTHLQQLMKAAKSCFNRPVNDQICGGIQIIVQDQAGRDLALTPLPSHRVHTHLHHLLNHSDYYRLGQCVHIGSGLNIPTYGNLVSDSAGKLNVLSTGKIRRIGIMRILFHQIENGHLPFEQLHMQACGKLEFRFYQHKGTGEEFAYLNFRYANKIRKQIRFLVRQTLHPILLVRNKLKCHKGFWLNKYQSLMEELLSEEKNNVKQNIELGVGVYVLRYVISYDSIDELAVKKITTYLGRYLEAKLGIGLPGNIRQFVSNDCHHYLTKGLLYA